MVDKCLMWSIATLDCIMTVAPNHRDGTALLRELAFSVQPTYAITLRQEAFGTTESAQAGVMTTNIPIGIQFEWEAGTVAPPPSPLIGPCERSAPQSHREYAQPACARVAARRGLLGALQVVFPGLPPRGGRAPVGTGSLRWTRCAGYLAASCARPGVSRECAQPPAPRR
jgi:hypothetical protein